ncbi:hypothetical protein Fcan01_23917 [Folsomia candida]|uniref:Uncharacterized protein n=1 Tax=Folsomia candida TaxID=158441 RepID=A0A226D8D6_FOLCA|nr:hypothetical protein Fcan01_23917 [Folsomia candida]
MIYLPTKDLFTCTVVNLVWEKEARNRLRSRTVSNIELKSPMEILRPYYNEQICLSWGFHGYSKELLRRLEDFAVANRNKVRHLTIPFFIDGGNYSNQFFKILKIFGDKLTSLRLQLFLQYVFQDNTLLPEVENLSSFLTNFTNKDLVFPSITNFEFDSPNLPSASVILAKLAPIFPNVTMLQCQEDTICGNIFNLQNYVSQFPKLKSFSFTNRASTLPPQIQQDWSQINLTRLEFYTSRDNSLGAILLQTVAPTLEKVAITLTGTRSRLWVPILPRLRVLKITRYDGKSCKVGHEVRLQFETEDDATGVKIDYEKQFPVLEQLIVRRSNLRGSEPDLQFCFDSTAQFLYSSFTPFTDKVAVCRTLRKLDIPLPPGKHFRLRHENDGVHQSCPNICNCWNWEESTKFLNRLGESFPNVKYHYLEERRLGFGQEMGDHASRLLRHLATKIDRQ